MDSELLSTSKFNDHQNIPRSSNENLHSRTSPNFAGRQEAEDSTYASRNESRKHGAANVADSSMDYYEKEFDIETKTFGFATSPKQCSAQNSTTPGNICPPSDKFSAIEHSEVVANGAEVSADSPMASFPEPRKKKTRTVFSRHQIFQLESTFEVKRYLSSSERAGLAERLNLTETQVKMFVLTITSFI